MKCIIAVISCFLFLSLIHAQTIVPEGEVFGIWGVSQSPYQVTGNIHIPHDSILLIEPGVEVHFQGHFQLKVEGRLLAEGTETDTILFTVNDTTGFSNPDTSLGGWYGIRIYDIDPMNDSTKLAYCRLEYGKAMGAGWFLNSGGALCVIDFDKVSVSNCFFTNNMAVGPDESFPAGGAVHLAWSDVKFTANTFKNNFSWAGGAIQFHESNPVFKDNLFSRNRCHWDGGALSSSGSNPSFSGDVFINNHSDEMGGAAHFGGGDNLVLDNLTITGNEANWGGGLGFQGCVAEIRNSTISDNRVTWLGGGVAADGSTITIKNSVFEKDSSDAAAGGIHSWQGTLRLEGVSFNGNVAWQGGAIHSDWSNLVAVKSNFSSNIATDVGGALKVFNSHMLMDSCVLDGNTSLVDVGAIDYAADTLVFDTLFVLRLLNTEISNNFAARGAGGLSIQQTHTRHAMVDLVIDHCEIADNRAQRVGGFRIMRCPRTVTLSNSLIHGNVVDAWTGGGAIAAGSTGRVYNCIFYNNHSATVNPGATTGGFSASSEAKVEVINCTFVGNSAGVGGGLMAYRGGHATVSNSLFWYNSPEQLGLSAVFDSLPSRMVLNYNDIQYGPDLIRVTDTVSSFTFGIGNIDTDPLFVDAGHADFRLQETSPVIGAAMDSLEIEGTWYRCPSTDIAGNPRPDPSGSKPDMGAFENMNAWPVGVEENHTERKSLETRNYPNPFKKSTTLEFYLSEQCLVSMEVYNLLGMKVSILNSEDKSPGIHRVVWTPPQENGHIYFYRITAVTSTNRTFMESGRMIQIE